jgi:hypothetical protein
MKHSNFINSKNPSKGDRLKWVPLREVHSVPLTKELTRGRQLTVKELSQSKNAKQSKLLVP